MAPKKTETEQGADTAPEAADRGGVNIAHLVRPFPPEAIATRKGGGGKDFQYIDFSAVVNRLNDATGYRWDFRILREEFVGDVLMVTGELTIPTLGTRAAVGVQKYVQNSGEDLLKGAASDCLKKTASLFGVGLFTCDDRYEETHAAAAAPPRQQPQPAPAPAPATGNGKADAPDPATVTVTQKTYDRILQVAIDKSVMPTALDNHVRRITGQARLSHCTEAQAHLVAAWLKTYTPPANEEPATDLYGAVHQAGENAKGKNAQTA